ncbi:hypothetical protein [Klebsiella pneumoniae]|uniref:hypothetical protein n=3 Tax=Klebsiella pneumoniae TaxID=573 RepID=UPI0011DE182E|nr:hypothetical protein [Klebsiella pneumoniae]QLU42225.1 hypothetical protein HV227_22630 [Klebsiella pneumoniae]TXX16255.1 hypothetical protein D4M54_13230 [Klebsiella pneumoniae]
MSNLPETPSWESGIHQLEEADRAKAGPGGVLNVQANQLANRTRWLKALVESAQDYREYTFYKSESDPDGTIAGLANTPAGKIFRVAQGLNDYLAFIYYLNDSGTAIPLTALIGRGAIINNVREYSNLTLAQNDVEAGNILDGSKCWVTSSAYEMLADEYINNGGALEATGRKMPSYQLIEPLINLIESVYYADNDEYSRSPADSAKMDKNHRWLLQWHGDEIWLKNADIKGTLKIRDLQVSGDVSFDDATINSLSVTSLDTDTISIGGVEIPVSFASPDEYARSPADSAKMDKNHRWLLFWEGDKLNLKNLAVKYGLTAGKIDTSELNINGVRAPLDYLNPDEYSRSPYAEVVVDKNLRIMQSTDDDGHVVIAGRLINPEPPASDSYEVYADAGKLYRINKTTSDRELIDSNTNNSNVQNAPEIFTFDSNRDDTVIGNKWFSAYSPYKPAAYFGRRAIVGFGHSFMANPRFLRTLSDLTGLPTYNFGRSGGLSRTVALREGAYTVSYAPVGGSIPASGSVALTPADPGVLQVVDNAAVSETVRGNLAGVDGTLAWDGTTLTFTRDASGSAVAVPAATPFIYYPYTIDSTNTVASGVRYDAHGDAINLLWLGRNNATKQGQILSDARAIIAHLTAHHKRFVILPEFQMSSETKSTYGNGNILWLNRELKKLAPDNYCEIDGVDLLANFNAHYNPAYAQDVAAIANGITPTSLRQDSLHPSQTLQANALYIGADVNAQFVYQFLLKKGWL